MASRTGSAEVRNDRGYGTTKEILFYVSGSQLVDLESSSFTDCISSFSDISELPDPKVSNNIILENRQKAKQVFSYLLHQTQSTGPLTHMLELKRGEFCFGSQTSFFE